MPKKIDPKVKERCVRQMLDSQRPQPAAADLALCGKPVRQLVGSVGGGSAGP